MPGTASEPQLQVRIAVRVTIPIPGEEIPDGSITGRYPSAWTERLDATLPWREQRNILEDSIWIGVNGGLACVEGEPQPDGGIFVEFLEIDLIPWPRAQSTLDELERTANVLGSIVSGMAAALWWTLLAARA